MMKKNLLAQLVFYVIVCFSFHSFGQMAAVDVDHFSGSANVSVPLYNVSYGKIPIPIMLTYNGGGIKVKQVEGNAGLGWNVLVGGEITRQVRGLPDDIQYDLSGTTFLGWLYSGVGANVSSFNFLNDNNQATTGDEDSDIYPLTYSFPINLDTEPDIFYVNAPGLNCKLIFDGNGVVRTIPYMDFKVSYQTFNTYGVGQIKGFQITNSQGITYHFETQERITKSAGSYGPATNIKFFKKEYDRYKNGINYTGSWKLSKVSDPGGYYIQLAYTIPHNVFSQDRMEYAIGNSTTMQSNFSNFITTRQIRPTKISFSHDNGLTVPDPDTSYPELMGRSIDLSYGNAPTSGQYLINSISGLNKTVALNYSSKTSPLVPFFTRTFLRDITVNGKRSSFEYYGESQFDIDLPDSTSKQIDLWGYYNNSAATSLLPGVYINPTNSGHERLRSMSPGSGSYFYPYSIVGEDRYVNSSVIANGSLKKINYDDGGSTTIVYEPNNYKDQTAVAVVSGGGIRVKSITSYDGVDALKNIVRTFNYNDPVTGESSGKAISVPILAFTTPYSISGTTEQQWQNSVVRMEENFFQEYPAVVYTSVRESVTGAGSSLHQYKAPGTFWDIPSADWLPTLVNVARPTSTFGGYATNEVNTYPFPPNSNYDFERGLLDKITKYNENGDKVSELSYTYQRTGTPLTINALVSYYNNNVISYAKYPIYTTVGNLIQQENIVHFDAPSTSQFKQTVTNYSYNGNGHKLPTLVTRMNSDGSIFRDYSKYVRDYDATIHSDEQSTAVYNLQQLGINFPVETFSQVQKNGLNKTYGASIIKLKPWTLGSLVQNLPVQSLTFSNPAGIVDFSASGISGGNFIFDNRYIKSNEFLGYSSLGIPVSIVGRNKIANTSISGLFDNRSLASFSNASLNEIAFNNFDDDNFDHSFIPAYGGTYTNDHRSGQFAFDFAPANFLSRQIIKNNFRKEYILSVWVNSLTGANLTLTLTNSNNSTSSYVLSVAATGGSYRYYELKVPISSMSNEFGARINTDQQIKIDDLIFYPSDAVVNTSSYDFKLQKTSTTNTNGVSMYFSYDHLNRLSTVRDQDKNIVSKKSYVSLPEQQANTSFFSSSNNYAGQPSTFNAYAPRADDFVTYTWNFGDGSSAISSSNHSVEHVYMVEGTYNVTLTKNSALFGSSSYTSSIVISSNNSPSIITGAGDLQVDFIQGSALVYRISGSALYSGTTTIAPGAYTVNILTSENPFSGSYPYGFKSWMYDTYHNSTLVSTVCQPSSPNVKTVSFNLYIQPGRTYNFSQSQAACELVEIQ